MEIIIFLILAYAAIRVGWWLLQAAFVVLIALIAMIGAAFRGDL